MLKHWLKGRIATSKKEVVQSTNVWLYIFSNYFGLPLWQLRQSILWMNEINELNVGYGLQLIVTCFWKRFTCNPPIFDRINFTLRLIRQHFYKKKTGVNMDWYKIIFWLEGPKKSYDLIPFRTKRVWYEGQLKPNAITSKSGMQIGWTISSSSVHYDWTQNKSSDYLLN